MKEALRDHQFRKSLPPELKEDLFKYDQNPTCPCNLPIYHRILKIAAKQLMNQYPDREVVNPDEELLKLVENHWKVINCEVNELDNKLKELGPGRKQLAVARWEDKVTVIVNELDY